MSFNSDVLLQALDALSTEAPPPRRYVIAFSGGLDSTVLLHALHAAAQSRGVPLLAVHIDHGMQAESAAWAEHCAAVAGQLGVEYAQQRVEVGLAGGKGPEAAARDARYAALATVLEDGDWLLSAHHQDDQAETLLLNLLRGSGPAGLAGIAGIRPFANGWLARPMLAVKQDELLEYAKANDLDWIDDPSNDNAEFDRNYLRHEVLPKIEARWPGAAERLHRSSRIAADAAAMLDDIAALDLEAVGGRVDRLELPALQALPERRQKNVLRYAIRQRGLAAPSAAHIDRVLAEVIKARVDAEPVLSWADVEIRRFRDRLYILRAKDRQATPQSLVIAPGSTQVLGSGLGTLRLEQDSASGLDDKLVSRGLELRYRQGGEKIRPLDQSHTKTLKNLLNEASIVPWMRDRIPLLYAGEELVAVADLWLAQDAVRSPGVAVHWDDRPPLH